MPLLTGRTTTSARFQSVWTFQKELGVIIFITDHCYTPTAHLHNMHQSSTPTPATPETLYIHTRVTRKNVLWLTVNICHRVTLHTRHLWKLCEYQHESLNDLYHDAEQLKEGNALHQWVSLRLCSHVWAWSQFLKRCSGCESSPRRCIAILVFIFRTSLFDWLPWQQMCAVVSGPQPPSLIAAQSIQRRQCWVAVIVF